MKFFKVFTKCFSRQDIEEEQVSQEDIENEDQSNGDNAVPWICLFENPGLQHIGRKILLEVPFHLEFRPFKYRNKKNFLACRLVCKTFKDIIDNPSFWLQKMEMNFTLDHQLWKTLIDKAKAAQETMKSSEVLALKDLEMDISRMLKKMYIIRNVWSKIMEENRELFVNIDLLEKLLPFQGEEKYFIDAKNHLGLSWRGRSPPQLVKVLKRVADWQLFESLMKNVAMFGTSDLVSFMLKIGMDEFLTEEELEGTKLHIWVPHHSVYYSHRCDHENGNPTLCGRECEMVRELKVFLPYGLTSERLNPEQKYPISWILVQLAALYSNWEIVKLLLPCIQIDKLNIDPDSRDVPSLFYERYETFEEMLKSSCEDHQGYNLFIHNFNAFFKRSMKARVVPIYD